jgi:hypothetical protein
VQLFPGEIAKPDACRVIDSGVLNGHNFIMPPGTYTVMEDSEAPHPLSEAPVYPKLPPKDQRLVITITPDSDTATNK